VDIKMLELLIKIQSDPEFDPFYLAGGTALSLQIGHRKSVDIDLFTNNSINIDKIQDSIYGIKKENYSIINQCQQLKPQQLSLRLWWNLDLRG
jgi:hypothetical protein